jgi:hypothetical protein
MDAIIEGYSTDLRPDTIGERLESGGRWVPFVCLGQMDQRKRHNTRYEESDGQATFNFLNSLVIFT